ncbi:DUF6074 family protein [Rhizobium sp. Rhizsp82]|uniref:DUF6074 family protein n=1 Tax=Rhizobium sp. Rhizsp82 TaxID=3243057 RepID=UPI0039B5EA8F
MSDDLPLFTWKPPPCRFLVFPLTSRVGKIRDTASKLLDKATSRHRLYYRSQVSDALCAQLQKLAVPERDIEREIASFWRLVDQETRRQAYQAGISPEELG